MIDSLVITADEAGMIAVEGLLEHFFEENHLASYSATISVAVMQAVSYAVKHADTDKITLQAGTCRRGVFFVVSGRTRWFDDENAEDALFFINTLSDRVEFSDEGRTLRMEFDISGIYPDDSICRASRLMEFEHLNVVRVL